MQQSPLLPPTCVEVWQVTEVTHNCLVLMHSKSLEICVVIERISPASFALSNWPNVRVQVGGAVAQFVAIEPAYDHRLPALDASCPPKTLVRLRFRAVIPNNLTGSLDVTVTATASIADGHTVQDRWTRSYSVAEPLRIAIRHARVVFTEQERRTCEPAAHMDGAVSFLRRVFPVPDEDEEVCKPVPGPALLVGEAPVHVTWDGFCPLRSDLVLGTLSAARQCLVEDGVGATSERILFGRVDSEIDGLAGKSISPGFVAFGTIGEGRDHRTFAHEIGHCLGLGHHRRSASPPPASTPPPGWIQEASATSSAGAGGSNHSPAPFRDFMDISSPGAPSFVASETYRELCQIAQVRALVRAVRGGARAGLSSRVAVIQGYLSAGTDAVRMLPVFRYPWLSEPSLWPSSGNCRLEIIDDHGHLTTHWLRFPDSTTHLDRPDCLAGGFFEVMVPVSPEREIDLLRIVDATDNRVVAELRRSPPPRLTLDLPRPGTALDRHSVIAWRIDGERDASLNRLYHVVYSPDDGDNWLPLAVNLPDTQTSFACDASQLPPSSGRGIIRLITSNGLSTVWRDVGGLSTP